MVPKLLVLALDFHRAPLRYRHLTDPSRPLPDAFGDWLVEASAAIAAGRVQTTAAALGSSPDELKESLLFLLRQILLVSGADRYRVLGLSRSCSTETVKQHHGLLVRLFHPDRYSHDDGRSVALTARINAAYQTLRDPQTRRRYDSRLPDGARANEDAVTFFCPHDPLALAYTRTQNPTQNPWGLPSLVRPALLWALSGILLAALVYLIIGESRQPLLRVNPDLAGRTAAGPSYLQGDRTQPADRRPSPQAGGQVRPAQSAPSVESIRGQKTAPTAMERPRKKATDE